MSESAETLRDNDTRLAELARGISAAQWSQPSLCAEWTNHEVLAHLVVGYQVAAVGGGRGHPAASRLVQRDQHRTGPPAGAQSEPDQLIATSPRWRADRKESAALFPKRLLLGDHVIHELDITYALGKGSSVPGADRRCGPGYPGADT